MTPPTDQRPAFEPQGYPIPLLIQDASNISGTCPSSRAGIIKTSCGLGPSSFPPEARAGQNKVHALAAVQTAPVSAAGRTGPVGDGGTKPAPPHPAR